MGSHLSKGSLQLWDDVAIHTTAKQRGCTQNVHKCHRTPVVIAVKLELQPGWGASITQKNHMQENEKQNKQKKGGD